MFLHTSKLTQRKTAICTWLITLGLLSGCSLPTPLDPSAKDAVRENLKATEEDSLEEHAQHKADRDAEKKQTLKALSQESDFSLAVRLAESRDRFDVDVKDMPAQLFFQGLVADTQTNIVVHPDVSGTISLSLRRVNLSQVLDAVASVYSYHVEKKSFGYKIFPIALRTQVYNLNYLNVTRTGMSQVSVNSGEISSAGTGGGGGGGPGSSTKSSQIETESVTDFWEELKGILSTIVGSADGRSVVVNPQAGIVVVHANPDEHRTIQTFIRAAEKNLRRQVIIEAKILEVELNESFQSGINWAVLSKFGNGNSIATGLFTDVFSDRTSSGAQALATSANQIISDNAIDGVFSSAVSIGDFRGLIELLETQGEVHVLSSPRISTVNNQKAVIKVGEDEFFVTEFTNNQTTAGDQINNAPEVTLTPFFSGIALDVTPQIGDSNEIILHIHPSVSEVRDLNKKILVAGEEINLPLALSRIRESDSIVKARNNQIIVIGGLLQTQTNDSDSSTPWFSKIPVINALFKQKRQTSKKSELVILLRPVVPEQEGWSGQLPAADSYLPNIGAPASSKPVIFR